jgi:hypothetical protein
MDGKRLPSCQQDRGRPWISDFQGISACGGAERQEEIKIFAKNKKMNDSSRDFEAVRVRKRLEEAKKV